MVILLYCYIVIIVKNGSTKRDYEIEIQLKYNGYFLKYETLV